MVSPTSIEARRARMGRPSLFLPLAAVAVGAVVILFISFALLDRTPTAETVPTEDQVVAPTGAGTNPDGIADTSAAGILSGNVEAGDIVSGSTSATEAEEGERLLDEQQSRDFDGQSLSGDQVVTDDGTVAPPQD